MNDSGTDLRTHPTVFKELGIGLSCNYSCMSCPKRWAKRAGGSWRLGKLWWCPDCTEKKARERAERKAA